MECTNSKNGGIDTLTNENAVCYSCPETTFAANDQPFLSFQFFNSEGKAGKGDGDRSFWNSSAFVLWDVPDIEVTVFFEFLKFWEADDGGFVELLSPKVN